ncbi:MAG TPA: HEPN domain-containing protein [bacterium]|nr:HEPN domain-containing protein [bacterium]
MNNDDLVKAWFDKAASDLRNAEIILSSGEDDQPTDTVCFHCQQAAEKFIKGFLASRDTEYQKVHNLKALVEKAMALDPSFEQIMEKAESLSPYAVAIRYPDDFWMPKLEDAQEAFAIAREIKDFILQRMKTAKTVG